MASDLDRTHVNPNVVTSDWLIQIEIGLAALDAGFIAPNDFAVAFKEVYGTVKPKTVDEVWVATGRLSKDQLATVLLASEFNRHTPPVAPTMAAHTVRVSGAMSAVGGRVGRVTAGPDAGERYRRLRVLGKGGMGEITECLDTRLGRKVAVKTVRTEMQEDVDSKLMLEREARVTGNLEHPGIVPVHDVGIHPALGSYYVMRRVEQPTLASVLSPLKRGENAEYPLGRLLRYFIQICEVADYAHNQGVIHCDLKPANILIGNFGEVMILDWGLAFRKDKGTGYRGGTPGFMAPEQAREGTGKVDERTDVYALGAILYEIVALAVPFDMGELATRGAEGDTQPGVPTAPPRLPSQRARHGRVVPPELDDACMKALSYDPDLRFPTAKALAAAVEAFLEGTAERERRQQRAQDMSATGDMLAENYHDFVDSRPERADELDQIRGSIPSWETPAAKQGLWDAEDRLEVMDALGVRMLHSAVAAYEQALDEVPGHAPARLGLARLYLAEYRRAAERRDDIGRVYFEELINQYDDGTVRRVMNADGYVTIETTPPVEVTIARVEQHARRLVPRATVHASPTPTGRLSLLPGSYLAEVKSGDRSIRYPIMLRSEQELAVAIDLAPAADLPPGEVYVPGGLTQISGDEDGRDLRLVEVGSFIIGTNPVAFSEYLEFLIDVARRDHATATRHVPRSSSGAPYWQWSGSAFEPTAADMLGYRHDQFLALPAFGIDAHSAIAYVTWLSERTGRAYRLPNELEWERAGRGADGRLFPWGERFDASFCKMRESRQGVPKPEPSGAFPDDTSPFGVRDLAGGVAEWVLPIERSDGGEKMMTRRGAWCDFANDCRLTARRLYLAVEFSTRIGFRIARTV